MKLFYKMGIVAAFVSGFACGAEPEEISWKGHTALRWSLDLEGKDSSSINFLATCQPGIKKQYFDVISGPYQGDRPERSNGAKFLSLISQDTLLLVERETGKIVYRQPYRNGICVHYASDNKMAMVRTQGADANETVLGFVSLPEGKVERRLVLNLEPITLVEPSSDLQILALLHEARRAELDGFAFDLTFYEVSTGKRVKAPGYFQPAFGAEKFGNFFFQPQSGNFVASYRSQKAENSSLFLPSTNVIISSQTGKALKPIEMSDYFLYSKGLETEFFLKDGHFIAKDLVTEEKKIHYPVPENDYLDPGEDYPFYEVILSNAHQTVVFTALLLNEGEVKTHIVAWDSQTFKEKYRIERPGAWTAKDILNAESRSLDWPRNKFFYRSTQELDLVPLDPKLMLEYRAVTPDKVFQIPHLVVDILNGNTRSYVEVVRPASSEVQGLFVSVQGDPVPLAAYQKAVLAAQPPKRTPEVSLEKSRWVIPGALMLLSNGWNYETPEKFYSALVDFRTPNPTKLFEAQHIERVELSGQTQKENLVFRTQDVHNGPLSRKKISKNYVVGFKEPGAKPFPVDYEILDKSPGKEGLQRMLIAGNNASAMDYRIFDGRTRDFIDPTGFLGVPLSSRMIEGSIYLISRSTDRKQFWLTKMTK